MNKNELIINTNNLISNNIDIKSMIYTIRGQQVMLDSDLAKLYGYEVKRLNEMVKNNIDRFPDDFMWRLSLEDLESVRSKFSTSRNYTLFKGQEGGRRYLPYVFTEQGIYALSGILKGPLATAVSINLIRTFKELKDLYNNNAYLFERFNDKLVEYQTKTNNKLYEYDINFNRIFTYISNHKEVKEKIFFKGQIYDAYSLLIDLIAKAKKEIILIDNYIDKITLDILSHKANNVKVAIYTNNNKCNNTDINKFNEEYPSLTVHKSNNFHDRFLILDNKTIYLIGASLKDAGKKTFGIIEIDKANIKTITYQISLKD